MTILSVINEVADVVGLSRFQRLIGLDDENAQLMISLATEAGEEIARRVDWQTLLSSATITATPFPLPTDFQRLIPGAAVRTAAGLPFRPVTNGSQWAIAKSVPSLQPYFYIQADAINLLPASIAASAVVDYVSDRWVMTTTGPDRTLKADDNTARFPERLLMKNILWRWKRQKGLPFDDPLAEFEADLVQEIKADRGAP